jgi:hypothetical protein
MGSAPSTLSIVSVTSARPSGARGRAAKMTSSIFPPRGALAPARSTRLMASTTLDFPSRSGPTQVMPGSGQRRRRGEGLFSVRLLRCTGGSGRSRCRERTGRGPARASVKPQTTARVAPALDPPPGRVRRLRGGRRAVPRRRADYPLQPPPLDGREGSAPRRPARTRAHGIPSTSGNPRPVHARVPRQSVGPSFRPCATVAHRDRL